MDFLLDSLVEQHKNDPKALETGAKTLVDCRSDSLPQLVLAAKNSADGLCDCSYFFTATSAIAAGVALVYFGDAYLAPPPLGFEHTYNIIQATSIPALASYALSKLSTKMQTEANAYRLVQKILDRH